MESRVQQAAQRHSRGYNCAQAVACTYCDLFGVDEQMSCIFISDMQCPKINDRA